MIEQKKPFVAMRLVNAKLITLIDQEDYERVKAAGPWAVGYYRGRPNKVRKFMKSCYLHHFVLNQYPKDMNGLEIGHINMNALDNRKNNLHWITHSRNLHELPLSKMSRTGHKNIQITTMRCKYKNTKYVYRRYRPKIKYEGKFIKTLTYKTLPEAIAARDEIYKRLGYADIKPFEIDHEKYWEEAEPINGNIIMEESKMAKKLTKLEYRHQWLARREKAGKPYWKDPNFVKGRKESLKRYEEKHGYSYYQLYHTMHRKGLTLDQAKAHLDSKKGEENA